MRSTLTLSTLVFGVLAILAVPSVAPAALVNVTGYNANINANGGGVYIPLNPHVQTNLGDVVGPGYRLGMNYDVVELDPATTATSTGLVSWVYNFDLTSLIDPAKDVLFKLTTYDLDFKTSTSYGLNYTETMMIEYVPSGTTVPQGTSVLLTGSNYGSYRPDGAGATNNTRVVYTFNLADDLGLTLADFIDINTAGDFGLKITLQSFTERTEAGTERYRNTIETLSNVLTYTQGTGVPEPITLALFATGTFLMVRRRKARKA